MNSTAAPQGQNGAAWKNIARIATERRNGGVKPFTYWIFPEGFTMCFAETIKLVALAGMIMVGLVLQSDAQERPLMPQPSASEAQQKRENRQPRQAQRCPRGVPGEAQRRH
ncbi:MAG: hypothetical protein HRU33_15995 [Rhodobacteraceae bacterium]|nr:hypothetical protein [Paracoccaceae bacterium]